MLNRVLGQWKAHRRKPLLDEDVEDSTSRFNPLYEGSPLTPKRDLANAEIDAIQEIDLVLESAFRDASATLVEEESTVVRTNELILKFNHSPSAGTTVENSFLHASKNRPKLNTKVAPNGAISTKNIDEITTIPEVDPVSDNRSLPKESVYQEVKPAVNSEMADNLSVMVRDILRSENTSEKTANIGEQKRSEKVEAVTKQISSQSVSQDEHLANTEVISESSSAMSKQLDKKDKVPNPNSSTQSVSNPIAEAKHNIKLKTRAIDELIKKFQEGQSSVEPTARTSFLHSNREKFSKPKPMTETENVTDILDNDIIHSTSLKEVHGNSLDRDSTEDKSSIFTTKHLETSTVVSSSANINHVQRFVNDADLAGNNASDEPSEKAIKMFQTSDAPAKSSDEQPKPPVRKNRVNMKKESLTNIIRIPPPPLLKELETPEPITRSDSSLSRNKTDFSEVVARAEEERVANIKSTTSETNEIEDNHNTGESTRAKYVFTDGKSHQPKSKTNTKTRRKSSLKASSSSQKASGEPNDSDDSRRQDQVSFEASNSKPKKKRSSGKKRNHHHHQCDDYYFNIVRGPSYSSGSSARSNFSRHQSARRSSSDASKCSCWRDLMLEYAFARRSLREPPTPQELCTCRIPQSEFLEKRVQFSSDFRHQRASSVTTTIPEESDIEEDSKPEKSKEHESEKGTKEQGKMVLMTPWELEAWENAQRRKTLLQRRRRARVMGLMALGLVMLVGSVVAAFIFYLRSKGGGRIL